MWEVNNDIDTTVKTKIDKKFEQKFADQAQSGTGLVAVQGNDNTVSGASIAQVNASPGQSASASAPRPGLR